VVAVNDFSSLHFPPEWAPQSAVLIAWPYAASDFSPWQEAVEETYSLIAQAIAARQILLIACRDSAHAERIQALLKAKGVDLAAVRLVTLPYDDVWVRDTAPLTIETEQGPRLLDFRFNGWGNKYEHGSDAALARRLHESGVLGQTPRIPVDFVLEGGSLETDGAGTLLTTARCLLNPNRNPQCSQDQIEAQLKRSFGLTRILWLHHGHAEGDDTDAHVDTLARFCSEDTIAYTACDDPADPLYPDLKAMADELAALRQANGEPYRLVPLPIPARIDSAEGDRLPATYANFLIINGAVLLPVYGDPADGVAAERLATCFPGREILAIPSTPLIRQYGSIHCMSMQFPKSIAIATK
jgi:agmatine/peptidylarginine deiminase